MTKVCKGIPNILDFALHKWISVISRTNISWEAFERSVQSEDKQNRNYILRFKEDRIETELAVI